MEIRVGEIVRVKSIEWYMANKNGEGSVHPDPVFTRQMSKYCGKVITIKEVYHSGNFGIQEDQNDIEGPFTWSQWMIEDINAIGLPNSKLPYVVSLLQGMLANSDYTNMSEDTMVNKAISILNIIIEKTNS